MTRLTALFLAWFLATFPSDTAAHGERANGSHLQLSNDGTLNVGYRTVGSCALYVYTADLDPSPSRWRAQGMVSARHARRFDVPAGRGLMVRLSEGTNPIVARDTVRTFRFRVPEGSEGADVYHFDIACPGEGDA
ncbi:MAG: hypothetical protein AAGH15_12575 [Myxococcota bacterium]